MSMISAQIDELRKLADGQAPYRDARAAMLEAADTILELRDDLQRANDALRDAEHDESCAWDRVRKVEAENAKLRELVQQMYPIAKAYLQFGVMLGRIDGMSYDWALQMIELGVEVDE